MAGQSKRRRSAPSAAATGGGGDAASGVPPRYAERYREIVTRTDRVCDASLNAEYKALCRKIAVTICQKGSPVLGGKPEGWVAGIVYALVYRPINYET
jgi:hypothetical protein